MIRTSRIEMNKRTKLNFNKTDIIMLMMMTTVIICSFIFYIDNNISYIPVAGGIRIPASCLFKDLTGFNCPTCGMTRSFISVGHGDFYGAMKYNLGGILAFALCVQEALIRTGKLLVRGNAAAANKFNLIVRPIRNLMKLQGVVLVLLLIVNWVLFYNVI
jgi:hypothetical protein